jgi:hypothetical protein
MAASMRKLTAVVVCLGVHGIAIVWYRLLPPARVAQKAMKLRETNRSV